MSSLSPKEHLSLLTNIPQHVQKSPEWFKQREGKLTSSDAGTALGLNPYSKPVELLFKKCGAGEGFVGNVATLHGQKYEDEAIEQYCKAMGKVNHEFGCISFDEVVRDNDNHSKQVYPNGVYWLAGSTDGIAEDVRDKEDLIVLEVKCPYKRKIIYGKCPEYYYPQVQLNMAILNIEKADFIEYRPPMYNDPMELNIVRINRDRNWFDVNVPIMEKLWKDVEYWRTQDIKTHPEYYNFKYHRKTLDLGTGEMVTGGELNNRNRELMFLDSDSDSD